MKLKCGYRYYARLSSDEVDVIKNALELLLETYDSEPYLDLDFRKEMQKEGDVRKLLNEFNEEE